MVFVVVFIIQHIFITRSASQRNNPCNNRVSLVLVTGGMAHYPKNWLVPPCPPPLFCPKHVDFVIFIQFLAILPKLSSQHKSNPFGKPWIETINFTSESLPFQNKVLGAHYILDIKTYLVKLFLFFPFYK